MSEKLTHQEFFAQGGEYVILTQTPTSRKTISIERLYQHFADRLRHELQRDEMAAVVKEENDKIAQRRKAK